MTVCPIECINSACPEETWLQTHENFVLTLVGLLGAGVGILLTYFLKSRCKHIKCCCLSCDREPVNLRRSSGIDIGI